MISHNGMKLPAGGAVIFNKLGGFTCSICAPLAMTQAEVEAFATRELGEPRGGWKAVDKSKIGIGTPTPNPCNQESAERQHWFLLGGRQAAALGLPTKK